MMRALFAAAICGLSSSALAQDSLPPIPISQLPRATLPLNSESVPVVQNGTTKQAPAYALTVPVFLPTAPASPIVGMEWFNTSAEPWVASIWDGLEWVTFGTLDPTTHSWTESGSATPCGTSGQLQYNNGGGCGGTTIGGDASLNAGSGALTVTKTNGTPFGTLATANAATPPALGTGTPNAGTFSAITDTAITGSTQCVHVNAAGTLSGVGQDCGSGSATAGGTNGQVQYNNNGSFGGETAAATTPISVSGLNYSCPTCATTTNGGALTASSPLAISAGGQISLSGIVPSANGGAGTVSGALKGNGSGVVSQAACADISNAGTFCSSTAASGLSGTLNAAQMPALSGDISSPAGSTSVSVQKINGNTPGNSCTSHQWVASIDTSARGSCTQPASGDLSDIAPCAKQTSSFNLSSFPNCHLILVDASGGNVAVTVPLGSGVTNAYWTVQRIDTSTNTLTETFSGSDSDAVTGATSFAITGQGSAVKITGTGGTLWD